MTPDKVLPYELWDVFTTEPFYGNPLAVVPDAGGLSDAQLQRIANEFNLSETSFVLPSENAVKTAVNATVKTAVNTAVNAAVRARYFTPTQELPIAGHPSVGTVFALADRGKFTAQDEVTLTLNIGPVQMTLEREGDTLKRVWMNQGVPELLETFDKAQVASALGLGEEELEPHLPVQLGSAGNPFLLVPVVSLDALARAQVSLPKLAELLRGEHRAVFAFTRRTSESDVRARMLTAKTEQKTDKAVPNIRARMLGAALGVYEDPATGSAHGPLGAYLAAHTDILPGNEAEFVSHQGVEMGRKSELFVRLERTASGVQVSVGGAAVKVGEGQLFL